MAKYWSFSLSISPSNEHPGLISFKMDWLNLLAVQGTLKSLLQHHSSKASIIRHSAFFTVQLSHPYMTTGKTIALIRRTFVGEVMSLLFNMLSRLVITFLPRSKRLLISWLQSPSAVILEPRKIKSDTVSTVSPSNQMFKLVLEKAEEPESKLPNPLDHGKSKRIPEKHLFLLYWLCQSLWLCGSQYTVENSEIDGNTRPLDLPPEKSICRSRSKS